MNLGALLASRGDLNGAERCFRRALELAPGEPSILLNLGRLLREMDKLDEAEACLRRALAAAPGRAATHAALGNVLHAQGRYRDAIASYRAALAIEPRAHETLCDLGNALSEEHALEDAIIAYRDAIAARPDYARAHAHLSTTLLRRHELAAAGAASEEAMRLAPDLPSVRMSRAHLKMMQGDYAAGLPLYEARFQEKALSSNTYATLQQRAAALAGTPRWQGEDAKGASLLVWSEQGLGDALMMLRYLPLLKARGVSKVALYCEAPLVRLVRTLAEIDEVIPASEAPPAGRFDLHCPMMSLPLAFGSRLETIPGSVPYLRVPPTGRLAGAARPRVGLSWAGNPANPSDKLRSVPLEHLAPLLELADVRFVSLQKEDVQRERLAATGWPVIDRMGECADVLDTAGLIGELDLVIGVDTAVAHLAGALGKPVWLLNRFESEWRWMLEGEKSAWYPTLRILRQPSAGDWESVIARAARELGDWLADFHRGVGRH